MMVDKNKPTDLINGSKKDDLPYMPFYVGDWLKAPDIQCLSYELKGLWFEMLCYMWESKERGVLIKANSAPYTIAEVSRLLRLPEVLLKQKLKQLLEFAIYSIRESDGAIYSRRMVKDQRIREIRKKAGSKGGKNSFASRFAQAKTQANSEDESETENVNETEFQNVVKKWNEFAELNNLPEVIKITDKRRSSITARLKEKDFNLEHIFQRILGSDFLLGKTNGFRASFDFVFEGKNNYIKILEGGYNGNSKGKNFKEEKVTTVQWNPA